jgi:hypothetical protein
LNSHDAVSFRPYWLPQRSEGGPGLRPLDKIRFKPLRAPVFQATSPRARRGFRPHGLPSTIHMEWSLAQTGPFISVR